MVIEVAATFKLVYTVCRESVKTMLFITSLTPQQKCMSQNYPHTYLICENSEFKKLSDLAKMAQPIKGRLGFRIPGAIPQTICSQSLGERALLLNRICYLSQLSVIQTILAPSYQTWQTFTLTHVLCNWLLLFQMLLLEGDSSVLFLNQKKEKNGLAAYLEIPQQTSTEILICLAPKCQLQFSLGWGMFFFLVVIVVQLLCCV